MEFEFKKSLGQNFIHDDNIIDKIIKYSDVDKDTLVIEIGPGAGSLSKKLVPTCGYAILYEIDTRLKEQLDTVLNGNTNYEIIFGDFLKQDIQDIGKKYGYDKIYVVANLPYYITTAIIIKLMNELYPDKIVIMVQEEVADRLSGTVGSRDYGMITALLGARYDIKKLFKVSKNCFTPRPMVDSAVICMDKCDMLGDVDYKNFEKLLKDAFQYKRKNLKNNLKGYDLEKIECVLNKCQMDLSCRAEDVPISVFIEIAKVI